VPPLQSSNITILKEVKIYWL